MNFSRCYRVSEAAIQADSHSYAALPWLFSARVDLWTFLGSALFSLSLLAVGAFFGLLDSDSPGWTWIIGVLLIDVAHVYATGFRVYFDRQELVQRPWLYGLTPLLAFAIGWAVYSESVDLFWRVLAYVAVFHFVRQQYGWVALYRSRGGETGRVGWWIDASAIYLATIYPLVYWHSQLPRHFWWFREGDFARLSIDLATYVEPLYWSALVVYGLRSGYRAFYRRQFNPGKDIVVCTTAVVWHIGIITFNSDYAFLVTNVIIHGIPYMVLTYWYRYRRVRSAQDGYSTEVDQGDFPRRSNSLPIQYRIATFLGIVWMLAYVEELLWDSGVWHERAWLFGSGILDIGWHSDRMETLLVPLLAVPQITHYVLDGFIWRRKTNAKLYLPGSARLGVA